MSPRESRNTPKEPLQARSMVLSLTDARRGLSKPPVGAACVR